MSTKVRTERRRPWAQALLGSAAVSIALAVVWWTLSDPVVATIMSIAVVTIALIAVWSERRHACHARSPQAAADDSRAANRSEPT
jgi:hypothetical protein